ncbi:MAG: TIGR00725 family protein [Promethearchaeota archaeon]|nr:MAG: TIGR00725 family protein [Candidatus Lokiarchaeota archaeon]
MQSRKKIIAIIGASSASKKLSQAAEQLGTLLIDKNFRIICGGLFGVMEAISRGARRSVKHLDGDIIGILPGFNKSDANEYIDIVIPTGFGYARNLIIVTAADVVVAIGGGAGTLSEISFAWQFQKPIIALDFEPRKTISEKIDSLSDTDFEKTIGWSSIMGELKLDETRLDRIYSANTPGEVVERIEEILEKTDSKKKIKLRYDK